MFMSFLSREEFNDAKFVLTLLEVSSFLIFLSDLLFSSVFLEFPFAVCGKDTTCCYCGYGLETGVKACI